LAALCPDCDDTTDKRYGGFSIHLDWSNPLFQMAPNLVALCPNCDDNISFYETRREAPRDDIAIIGRGIGYRGNNYLRVGEDKCGGITARGGVPFFPPREGRVFPFPLFYFPQVRGVKTGRDLGDISLRRLLGPFVRAPGARVHTHISTIPGIVVER
jgi:hypothetical protein